MSTLTFLGVVYPHQMDHMGHLNVQHYTAFFDQATWVFFAGFGITGDYMREQAAGMAALVQHTEYKAEVFAGDVLEIWTSLLAVSEKTIRFRHTMRRRPGGEVVATSELVGAHLDRAAHRARSFPDAVRDRLLSQLRNGTPPVA